MAIIFNSITVEKVIYNGVELDKIIYNGVIVFENIPQLATPQNVTADGTVVSWDEVENATSYEVLADGTSIGRVENEDALAGTWVFNDTIDASGILDANVDFICDEKQGDRIWVDDGWLNLGGIASPAYTNSGWQNEAYKTINITSKLSEVMNGEQLLTWLQANATKQ